MSNQLNLPGIDSPLEIIHDMRPFVEAAIEKGKETFPGRSIQVNVEMTEDLQLKIVVVVSEPEVAAPKS